MHIADFGKGHLGANAIVYGDITDELKEFAKLMRIPIVICA